jgi:hypothetical protein
MTIFLRHPTKYDNMNRTQVIRWLLEKLLGSFVISALVIWGPVLGMNLSGYGIGTVYTIITGVSLMVNILVFLLVPADLKLREKLNTLLGREPSDKSD